MESFFALFFVETAADEGLSVKLSGPVLVFVHEQPERAETHLIQLDQELGTVPNLGSVWNHIWFSCLRSKGQGLKSLS